MTGLEKFLYVLVLASGAVGVAWAVKARGSILARLGEGAAGGGLGAETEMNQPANDHVQNAVPLAVVIGGRGGLALRAPGRSGGQPGQRHRAGHRPRDRRADQARPPAQPR